MATRQFDIRHLLPKLEESAAHYSTDAELASAVGVSSGTISKWRRKAREQGSAPVWARRKAAFPLAAFLERDPHVEFGAVEMGSGAESGKARLTPLAGATLSRSRLPRDSSVSRPMVFFISRLGQRSSPERQLADTLLRLLRMPLPDSRFEVVAAHEIARPGSINEQAQAYIRRASLVVANLTYECTAMGAELRSCEELKKRVILVCEKSVSPSVIVRDSRIVTFENSICGALPLVEDLTAALCSLKPAWFADPTPALYADWCDSVRFPETAPLKARVAGPARKLRGAS